MEIYYQFCRCTIDTCVYLQGERICIKKRKLGVGCIEKRNSRRRGLYTDDSSERGGYEKIDHINAINTPAERALEYFAYACKQQLFWDGNKRTSTMVASKILIENGEGILTIGKDYAEEFNRTLNHWYLKDEVQPLKDCLKKCIKTLQL